MQDEVSGYLFIMPWLVGFIVFTLGPMLYSLYISLLDYDFLTTSTFVGIHNYEALLGDDYWPKALLNTAVYAFASVPLRVVFSFLVAILLNQKIVGLSLFRTIYYLPSVVQGVAVSVLWIWLFNPYFGPINGALGILGIRPGPEWLQSQQWAMPALIIMSLWGLGGSMIIFLAGLQGVPQSLYDAASIDGAGALGRFWYVTVPGMTPTIFFSLVMGLIGSWQMFSQAYVMTAGGPNNATLTAVMMIYTKGFEQFHFGYASAMAWVLFIIIMFFTFLVFKSSAVWVYYEGALKK